MDMNGMVIAWKRERMGQRLQSCLAMLKIHGFVSERECAAIKKRLARAAKRPAGGKG